ncbi:Acg family FMN-binding oxidoreductase [Aliiglaciecola litoralis]|uniref:Nitroreductase family protein n=1 Tax=Aliiglaciecola litoralis TaxID=582857 RepID=A0ABP3X126_9ALTE
MAESYITPRQTHDEFFPYSGCKEDQLRFLLRYAVLAPSHYNAQPWKFRLHSDGIEIIKNASRAALTVDPQLRELTISCGAAVRMIEVAARYFALEPQVIFPSDNQSDFLARIELIDRHEPSDQDALLFHAIKERQTNRGLFTDAIIPNEVTKSCLASARELGVELGFTHNKRLKMAFASLTAFAVRHQLSLPWYRLEFASWMRSSISLKPDGMTGFGFFASNLPSPLARTTMKWLNRGKQIGIFNKNKVITASPILAVISTDADSQESWINTGRLLSDLLLKLTTVGLSASFMNQAIQEPKLRKQVAKLFSCEAKPQLVLRIGVAEKVQWTPRMPVDDCII